MLPQFICFVKQLLNKAAKLFLQEAGIGTFRRGVEQTAGGQNHNCSPDELFPLGCAALCALEVFVLSPLFCFLLTCSHPDDVKVRKIESFKASLRPNFFVLSTQVQ